MKKNKKVPYLCIYKKAHYLCAFDFVRASSSEEAEKIFKKFHKRDPLSIIAKEDFDNPISVLEVE